MNSISCINRRFLNVLRHSASRIPPSTVLASRYNLPNSVLFRGIHYQNHKRTTLNYVVALGVFSVGVSYAAVPLYRIFCQAYSYGGTVTHAGLDEVNRNLQVQKDRPIKIIFNADVSSSLNWNFKPQQTDITVLPGETALAFYTAKNPTDRPIVGVSSYNVIPFEAGKYFNKIQCFCFEEQQLNPHEQVDMPVFFYIDPEFVEDPRMEYVEDLILSYTFFEAKKGFKLPVPAFN